MEESERDPILELLKALADESRLSILRILNEGEMTVGDLARRVGLGEPTISHHLSRLRAVGLANLRTSGTQRFYRLNENGLARFKMLASEIELARPEPQADPADDTWIEALDWSEADKQVLRAHTRGGKIISLPPHDTRAAALTVLLRWLASLFAPDRLYSEKEVNAVLEAVYPADYVSLRRDLVDLGLLRRERSGRTYWLGAA